MAVGRAGRRTPRARRPPRPGRRAAPVEGKETTAHPPATSTSTPPLPEQHERRRVRCAPAGRRTPRRSPGPCAAPRPSVGRPCATGQRRGAGRRRRPARPGATSSTTAPSSVRCGTSASFTTRWRAEGGGGWSVDVVGSPSTHVGRDRRVRRRAAAAWRRRSRRSGRPPMPARAGGGLGAGTTGAPGWRGDRRHEGVSRPDGAVHRVEAAREHQAPPAPRLHP